MIPNRYVNQLLNTDCVEGMAEMPEECVPLTVTSPPYDGMHKYGGHAFDFEAIAKQLWRITRSGGVVAWVVQDQIVDGSETCTGARQKVYFANLGFRIHQTLYMQSKRFVHTSSVRYYRQTHQCFVLSKGKPRCVNLIRDKPNTTAGEALKYSFRDVNGVLCSRKIPGLEVQDYGVRGDVWTYDVGGNKTTMDKLDHPALMPEMLAEDLIVSWSRPGDLVFDPMAGAGTTCKMAMLNNRRYLGMEIHDPYCKEARARLAKAEEEVRGKSVAYLRDVAEGLITPNRVLIE